MHIDADGPLDGPTVYLPTPEQIAEITADIRSTWSMAEHYRRAGRKVPARFASPSDETCGRVAAVNMACRLGDGMQEPVD